MALPWSRPAQDAERGFLVDGKTDQAVSLMKQLKVSPPVAGRRRRWHFLSGSGQPIDTIHADNFSFFEELAAIVAAEPAEVFTPIERFHLQAIGIEHGKPFKPDAN
jgi:hypothetical protein